MRVKENQSHYRPEQALRIPGRWGSQISRQSAYEDGKVVSPTHRPPLPPRKYSCYLFLLEAESTPRAIVRPEGCQWKIPMTPLEIDPATFQLIAQCLNQLLHCVPLFFMRVIYTFPQLTRFGTNCCERETFTISLTLKVRKKDQQSSHTWRPFTDHTYTLQLTPALYSFLVCRQWPT